MQLLLKRKIGQSTVLRRYKVLSCEKKLFHFTPNWENRFLLHTLCTLLPHI